ncbi:homocitrate synthase [Pseudomonas sp. MWU13-3659]|uniref:homocitrate synthase n=1 Tax=Pseudomonas sp. MWU13-3659 TaxID=2986964 RepID=UPI0020761D9D|nr:homocitrate synthase [Pseudomonas sp. MWU13-3659]
MTGQKQSFVLMDCTFRDGGFQTDWRFSDAMVGHYFGMCQAAGVDIVEMGYLNLDPAAGVSHLGSFKALPESLSDVQRQQVDLGPMRAAVMIDAWRILDQPVQAVAEVILAAIRRSPFPIAILRIAAMSSQLEGSLALAKALAGQELAVMINLMQAAELTPEQLAHDLPALAVEPVTALYFADSFGRMLPEQVHRLFSQARELTSLPLGFHAHDNYGLAVANTQAALDAGARHADGTFAGIGRGAGNAPTETLALLKSGTLEMAECEAFLAEHIEPLRHTANWGYSPTYRCQAKHNVHPTYAQRLFEGTPLTGLERIDILGKIAGHAGAHKFDAGILSHYR